MAEFRFSVGPWNVHEGADPFGPEVRPTISLEEKIRRFKEIGLHAVQFHDDDAVPELNELGVDEIKKRASELSEFLRELKLDAEFVAPRLWMDPRTADGGFSSNSAEDREYALWRALRSIDIARALGSDRIVLWLAREGTLCAESKDQTEAMQQIISALNQMLAYDSEIRILIEPKPNEPIDRSFCPTIGHALALGNATERPQRMGVLVESAHATLAGLDPANEMAFALSLGKLWSVHLNDQNGLKYDQDKVFGTENLRQAFNQIRILLDNNYGANGEYVGLDVKAMRTQPAEDCFRHIENSLSLIQMMKRKAESFDRAKAKKLKDARNYEQLEHYVLEHLLGE